MTAEWDRQVWLRQLDRYLRFIKSYPEGEQVRVLVDSSIDRDILRTWIDRNHLVVHHRYINKTTQVIELRISTKELYRKSR